MPAGLRSIVTTSGTGLVGPTGVPKDIVAFLNGKLNEALANPELHGKMRGVGLAPRSGPPAEFESWAADQRQKWIRVASEADVKMEK